ncbi:uncharacterized membrane-anchored protein YitT (DUF2179 family) [Clostridium sardiniense]|nr:uncharacterized membrane-anchored protein YitT (DUF2179 family) [Clostridium sardiniense]
MLIRKKYSSFEIGKLGFILNCIIVIVGAIIFGIPKALYTLLSIFVQGVVLDRVLRGLNSRKLMLIITNESQAIINFVIKDMHRGVTSIPIEGEYTHKKAKMLYCIVTTREMLSLKNEIYAVDPMAFITIMDTSEVKGKGFKSV